MCEPVTMAVIGGGQAALGAIGQNQAIKARNKNRAQLYANDLARIHGEHLINISHYYLRGADAEIAWDENMLESSLATDVQQTIINETIAESLRKSEEDFVKMVSDVRVAKSLERTGQTARRAGRSARAALGRAKAARAGQLSRQRDKAAVALAEIDRIRRQKDNDAYANIGFEPQRAADPPKPVFEKGPSLFQTLAKVALGAAQGYMMGKSLKGLGKGNLPGKDLPFDGTQIDWTGTLDPISAQAFDPSFQAAFQEAGFSSLSSAGAENLALEGFNWQQLTTDAVDYIPWDQSINLGNLKDVTPIAGGGRTNYASRRRRYFREAE